MAARAAPATLKAAFLEPLARDLPAELAVHVFARADADFMGLFVGAGHSWSLDHASACSHKFRADLLSGYQPAHSSALTLAPVSLFVFYIKLY